MPPAPAAPAPGPPAAPASPSTGCSRQQLDQLELQRVGVLELVDEQVRVAAPQLRPDAGVAGDQVTGKHEQVVKAELAVYAADVGSPAGESFQARDEPAERRVARHRHRFDAPLLCLGEQ